MNLYSESTSYFVVLFGGIAFFLYGMTIASQALEKLMSNRISGLLNKLSESQFLAIIVGISLTTLLQSSGAVTSMLVGLGSAKVITLLQVMGVIIGSAIGSTLTVQLISLDLSEFALPLFIVAFSVYFSTKKIGLKHIATVFMGFSLLFIGIHMIKVSALHFSQLEMMGSVFTALRSNPILSLAVSTLLCAFVQSSAVTIGIAMSLASAGAITFYDAMLWVYGANIGTTSIALLASVGSNYIGKQVAWAHFFFKTIGVLIFFPLTQFFVQFLSTFDTTITRSIANGHLFFNLFSAMLFFPFIKKGSQIIEKMFPKSADEDFSAKYLNLNHYQSSALAVSYGSREIMRTADIVVSMIEDSLHLFSNYSPADIEAIKAKDNKVDFLYREIKMFLLDHANKNSSAVQQNIMSMILFLSDLERAADAIDINVVTLAIKKNALKLEFSDEGWRELEEMHAQVMKVARLAISSYDQRQLCEEVIRLKRELAKLEISYREHHVERLNRGMRDSINTSSIHMDLLSEYKRIVGLLANHAYKTT